MASDLELAKALQAQFDEEDAHQEVSNFIPEEFRFGSPAKKPRLDSQGSSIVAPEWEDLDPTPDLHALFLEFNGQFFWGKLNSCEVKWSPRMTLCAGVCSYQRRAGYCSIRLSVPLLKLRPRKDLVETLLHEMIHAFLFITDGDDDHDGHGPAFHKHMYRINKEAGTKISVYHSFHDEVALYKQHWWKCNGPCQKKHPFYGMVKRSMNRAPGPNDNWWRDHQLTCGGSYTKVKEPEGYGQKKSKSGKAASGSNSSKAGAVKGQKDIRGFINSSASQSSQGSQGTSNSGTNGTNSGSQSAAGGGSRGNIFGFGGTSFSSPGSAGGGLKTKGRVGTVVVGPNSKLSDNSSGGQVISSGSESLTNGIKLSQTTSTTSSSAESSPGTVKQTLRDFWSNKFGGTSSATDDGTGSSSQPSQATKPATNSIFTAQTLSLPPTAKTAQKPPSTSQAGKSSTDSKSPTDTPGTSKEETSKISCPICGKSVDQKEINQHLDVCLASSPPETPSQPKTPAANPFLDEGESQACPVCGREVFVQEMNSHLDYCIDANS